VHGVSTVYKQCYKDLVRGDQASELYYNFVALMERDLLPMKQNYATKDLAALRVLMAETITAQTVADLVYNLGFVPRLSKFGSYSVRFDRLDVITDTTGGEVNLIVSDRDNVGTLVGSDDGVGTTGAVFAPTALTDVISVKGSITGSKMGEAIDYIQSQTSVAMNETATETSLDELRNSPGFVFAMVDSPRRAIDFNSMSIKIWADEQGLAIDPSVTQLSEDRNGDPIYVDQVIAKFLGLSSYEGEQQYLVVAPMIAEADVFDEPDDIIVMVNESSWEANFPVSLEQIELAYAINPGYCRFHLHADMAGPSGSQGSSIQARDMFESLTGVTLRDVGEMPLRSLDIRRYVHGSAGRSSLPPKIIVPSNEALIADLAILSAEFPVDTRKAILTTSGHVGSIANNYDNN
jgi:hypothetical protein